MSADDPKRRRSRRPKDPPRDEPPAEGAFFRAPTRAFQALPTEVLDVDVHKDAGARPAAAARQDPQSRSRLPASLFEAPASDAPRDFAAPPPTEALETVEVQRLGARHAAFGGHDSDALELTNPDPFRVDLDSDERALLEVAREETHHDLFLQDLEGPPSETSTDVEAPKPISGLHALGAGSTDGGFEDNTVAIDSVTPGGQRRDLTPFLLEATDEDAALPSDAPSLELPAPAPPPLPNNEDEAQERYYAELREVIGAARVFDPKRPVHLVTDPGFREQSDEWPEITLDNAPRPTAPPSRRGFPLAVVGFLLSALVVTVGGVGIGFSLSKRGVSLDDLLGSTARNSAPAGAEGTKGAPAGEGSADDDSAAADAPAIDPAGTWRARTVRIYFSNVDDASRSGARGLENTLLKAFTSALASDEHARWGVVPTKPDDAGYGFALSLAVLSVDKTEDGSTRVRCALNGNRQHEPGGPVRFSVGATRRAEGSLAGADDETLAREASRACGFALALEFFTRALR